jgi:hypothetical protein
MTEPERRDLEAFLARAEKLAQRCEVGHALEVAVTIDGLLALVRAAYGLNVKPPVSGTPAE